MKQFIPFALTLAIVMTACGVDTSAISSTSSPTAAPVPPTAKPPAATVPPTTVPPTATNVPPTAAGTFPYVVEPAKDDKNRTVTILKGFDLKEFGGNDSDCLTKAETALALREEVGSPTEQCKIVVEWSLKSGADTVVSGVYALHPLEWFRLKSNVSGTIRYVGTMWYLPKGWNSHMFAADIAGDWSIKNPGLTTYVGLSPTNPWVEKVLDALSR